MVRKQQVRRPPASTAAQPSSKPFDEARDELFQHIMTCGVIGSDPDHQSEWFEDTMRYIGDRYHELLPADLTQLRVLGERFVQPPKSQAPDEAVMA